MPTEVLTIEPFRQALKRLARKFPAVLEEVENLSERLAQGERLGDKIPNVKHDVYKVRLKNPSAKKGKSGGFRVIYYLQVADRLFLISIYSKTEQENISAEAIQSLIDDSLPNA